MLNIFKFFSASTEVIICFLFFNMLMWCITLIGLWILKHLGIPGINTITSRCMILLMYCWIHLHFVEDICIYVHQCYGPVMFCFVISLVLVSEWRWPCRMSLEVFEKDRCWLFSKCLVEFICDTIWFWTFVYWEFFFFLISDSISLLIIGLFLFSVCSRFSLGRLYISRNLSISSPLSTILAYNCTQ